MEAWPDRFAFDAAAQEIEQANGRARAMFLLEVCKQSPNEGASSDGASLEGCKQDSAFAEQVKALAHGEAVRQWWEASLRVAMALAALMERPSIPAGDVKAIIKGELVLIAHTQDMKDGLLRTHSELMDRFDRLRRFQDNEPLTLHHALALHASILAIPVDHGLGLIDCWRSGDQLLRSAGLPPPGTRTPREAGAPGGQAMSKDQSGYVGHSG
jgi:hypothetical protein